MQLSAGEEGFHDWLGVLKKLLSTQDVSCHVDLGAEGQDPPTCSTLGGVWTNVEGEDAGSACIRRVFYLTRGDFSKVRYQGRDGAPPALPAFAESSWGREFKLWLSIVADQSAEGDAGRGNGVLSFDESAVQARRIEYAEESGQKVVGNARGPPVLSSSLKKKPSSKALGQAQAIAKTWCGKDLEGTSLASKGRAGEPLVPKGPGWRWVRLHKLWVIPRCRDHPLPAHMCVLCH